MAEFGGVLQEWWGLVDHIKTVADRVAAAGFVALAPDLYHGERAGSPDVAGKLMTALDIGRAAADEAWRRTFAFFGAHLRASPAGSPVA